MDKSAIRSSYKIFLESLAGRDFLEHLLTLEATTQGQGINSESMEVKAACMERIGVYYNLRTYLDDMSKPVVVQSKTVPSRVARSQPAG